MHAITVGFLRALFFLFVTFLFAISGVCFADGGGTTNYGWLVSKFHNFETGSVDIASREYSQQNKAPKLVLTIADTPCTIVDITPSPVPNQYGWNNTSVTVTFTCNDPDGVSSCNSPQTTSGEGDQVCVTARCEDTFGNIMTTSPCFKIDETPPEVTITYPMDGGVLDTCEPLVAGLYGENGSGLAPRPLRLESPTGSRGGRSTSFLCPWT
jgi:hypothetical protein